jgi:pantothenate kinase type III
MSKGLLIADAGHSRLKVHGYIENSEPKRWLLPLKPFTWPKNEISSAEVDEVLLMGTNERHLVRLRSHLSQAQYPMPRLLGVDLRVPITGKLRGVGNDRSAHALGAAQRFPGERILVVSAGTALTVELVDAKGVHLGGSIGMGWRFYRESMLGLDPKLVSMEKLNAELAFPGHCTEEAVSLGWLEASLGLIHRHLKGADVLIFTGGDAEILLPHFSMAIHDPHLAVDAMARQLGYLG